MWSASFLSNIFSSNSYEYGHMIRLVWCSSLIILISSPSSSTKSPNLHQKNHKSLASYIKFEVGAQKSKFLFIYFFFHPTLTLDPLSSSSTFFFDFQIKEFEISSEKNQKKKFKKNKLEKKDENTRSQKNLKRKIKGFHLPHFRSKLSHQRLESLSNLSRSDLNL